MFDGVHSDLARRIEQRSLTATLEAIAYTDHCLEALRPSQVDCGAQIEGRALLATQEAKAYADGALESLTMALRGMSKVVVQLSNRVARLEEGGAPTHGADPRGALHATSSLSVQIASLSARLGANLPGSKADGKQSQIPQNEVAQVAEQLAMLVVAIKNIETAMNDARLQICALDAELETVNQPEKAQEQ